MGLDAVEIVMRCEEVYGIDLPYHQCAQVSTVGDLYGLLCSHLGLQAVDRPDAETGESKLRPQAVLNLHTIEWTAEDVWATLVAIFVVQLQVQPDEVQWWARIQDDLGCD